MLSLLINKMSFPSHKHGIRQKGGTMKTNFFWKNILTKEIFLGLFLLLLYICIGIFENDVLGINLVKQFGQLNGGLYNLIEMGFGATIIIILWIYISEK